jgi:ABC-type uncharacterized transport system permease subunit
MPTSVLSAITALLYAGIAVYCWVKKWRPTPTPGAASHAVERLAIFLPLLLQAWLLYRVTFTEAGFNMGVGNAVSAITWLTLVIYSLSSVRYHLEALNPVVLPIAAVGALLPAVIADTHLLPYSGYTLFKAHLLMAFLAYALFTIAALHGVVMALAEKRLHARELSMLDELPPLMTMERLLFQLIGAGFVLLTLTLASGILFSEELFGKPLSFSSFTQHKTVFAMLSWIIYAALLIGRRIYGWRGRTALIWSLSGFAALVLAYVGSKVILEIVLHRM